MTSTKPIKAALLAAGALYFSISGAAVAQTYVDEYKAYMQALESGDTDEAATHGYAAWQKAEEAIGDNKLTAVLAYNYGQFVVFTDTPAAREAFERAAALDAAGMGDLPKIDLDLYLAFARLSQDNNNRKSRRALQKALDAYAAADAGDTEDTSRMWLALANAELLDKKFADAVKTAQRAEKAISAATPDNYQRRADVLMTQGIALILNPKAIAEDVLTANKIFIRASKLFPAQTSTKTFDRKLASILAWNAAAGSLLRSISNYQDDGNEYYGGTKVKLTLHDEAEIADPEKFQYFDVNSCIRKPLPPGGCNFEFSERPEPKWPADWRYRGYVGAVIIAYDIDKTGKVKDPFVLAEVPNEKFGEYAIESMAKWKADAPSFDHPDCLTDRIIHFTFEKEPG